MSDYISRQAAIDALNQKKIYRPLDSDRYVISDCLNTIVNLPSVQPERMTNRQWIDFLSAQFDISRTSAKEMLHGMMQWKKEDNFKKMFNGGGKRHESRLNQQTGGNRCPKK